MMIWTVKFRLSKKLKISNRKSESLWKLNNSNTFGKDFLLERGKNKNLEILNLLEFSNFYK